MGIHSDNGFFGLGIFAMGGVGHGIWHTDFGIETSIYALLSPTHPKFRLT
jgi:hypothetical protein